MCIYYSNFLFFYFIVWKYKISLPGLVHFIGKLKRLVYMSISISTAQTHNYCLPTINFKLSWIGIHTSTILSSTSVRARMPILYRSNNKQAHPTPNSISGHSGVRTKIIPLKAPGNGDRFIPLSNNTAELSKLSLIHHLRPKIKGDNLRWF